MNWLAAGAAVLIAVALLLPGLGATPFDDPGEGQHAEIAREIVSSHDWVTLRLNGVRYFDKPPLLYWLTAVSFRMFGQDEVAARLPPLLGSLLAVAATAVLGARLLGPAGGLIAGGALLSCALFIAFGRYVRPETLFLAAIQWGFTGLLLGFLDRARVWTYVGCAALGAASLVKDPLGLFGPLMAVGIALALARREKPLSAWLPPSSLALLLAVGFGWYLLAAARNANFLWYTVVDNHLLNALRLRNFPDEDIPLTTLEFLAVSGLGAFPWIIPAAMAMLSLARRRAWQNPDEAPWVALAIWTLGVFALFVAVPFKLPHYALPVYPAIALLATRGWQEREARPSGLIAVHALLFGVLTVGAVVVAGSDGKTFSDVVFSATDVYTRKESVRGESSPLPPWEALAPLVSRFIVICGVTTAALLLALVRRSGRLGLAIVTAGMLAVMPLVEAGRDLVDTRRAVATMARAIGATMGPNDTLVHEGPIENSGAVEFYSGRRPILLDGRKSVLGIGATFPDAGDTFWDTERFTREWLAGDRRLLLLSPWSASGSVIASLPPDSIRELRRENGRRLYDNQPRRVRSAGEQPAADAASRP